MFCSRMPLSIHFIIIIANFQFFSPFFLFLPPKYFNISGEEKKHSQLTTPNNELFFPPFSSLTHPNLFLIFFQFVYEVCFYRENLAVLWLWDLSTKNKEHFHTWDSRWTSGNSIATDALSKKFVTQISNTGPYIHL